MDARARTASAAGGRVYEDVQPQYRLNTADTGDTLAIDLSGLRADGEEFRKEHLRVLIDSYGNIKVSGEHPLASGGNRWRRFQKVHRLPEDCDASAIRATFDDGILYVVMPKLVREQPPALVPATEPAAQAPAASTDHPANGQQQVAPKPEPPAPKPEGTEAAAAMSTPPRATSSRAEEGDREVAEKEKGQMGPATAAGDSRQSEPTAEVKERRPWPPASVEGASPPPPEATAEKDQKHRVSRRRRPRHLLVNVAVAVLVLAGLCFYFINRKTGGGSCHA